MLCLVYFTTIKKHMKTSRTLIEINSVWYYRNRGRKNGQKTFKNYCCLKMWGQKIKNNKGKMTENGEKHIYNWISKTEILDAVNQNTSGRN